MVKTAKRVSSGLVIDAVIGQNAVGTGVRVKAIIDTGADLSIISETVFSELESKPERNERIRIRCAGENLTFDARKIGPITVKTGSLVLNTCLYVGPIEDDMIIHQYIVNYNRCLRSARLLMIEAGLFLM